jgi:hypothetical protein
MKTGLPSLASADGADTEGEGLDLFRPRRKLLDDRQIMINLLPRSLSLPRRMPDAGSGEEFRKDRSEENRESVLLHS